MKLVINLVLSGNAKEVKQAKRKLIKSCANVMTLVETCEITKTEETSDLPKWLELIEKEDIFK